MPLEYFQYLSNPNVGLYIVATDRFILVPEGMSDSKVKFLKRCFEVEDALRIRIRGSKLLGVLSIANSNGVVLPEGCEHEAKFIKEQLGVEAVSLPTYIALGNRVLTNDRGAVVDLKMPESIAEAIEDVLDVEVKYSTIAGLPYVGSSAVASNTAVYAHPGIRSDELSLIEKVLKVPVHTGTVVNGLPYVKVGLVVNSRGGVVGRGTLGDELLAISQAFGFGESYE